MQTVIGIDIGRSTTKVLATWGGGRKDLLFPSATCPAISISDEREAGRAKLETVTVSGTQYFIGDTALLQGSGDLIDGLRNDWVFSKEHAALFLGVLQKLQQANVPGLDKALIITGLPSSIYASQKQGLIAELSKFAPHCEFKIMQQPMGPYNQMVFSANGDQNSNTNVDDESWAIIEVGQFTTDIALVIHGRTVENAFGSCDGMRVAAENLQRQLMASKSVEVSLAEASELLQHKVLRNFGDRLDITSEVEQAADPVAKGIIAKANQLVGKHARQLNGILVAGGGAPLAIRHAKNAWPHAVEAANPRFAVADGFCRFGLALVKYRQASQQIGGLA